MQGILAIKLFGWEESFSSKLEAVRRVELQHLRKFVTAHAGNMFGIGFAPVVSSAVTFSVYSALGNELNASIIFPSMALFMLIRLPLQLVPMALSMAAEVRVSAGGGAMWDPHARTQRAVPCSSRQVAFGRISKFLHLPEMTVHEAQPLHATQGIEVSDASFVWGVGDVAAAAAGSDGQASVEAGEDRRAPFVLRDVSLSLPRGKLLAVVGRVRLHDVSHLSARPRVTIRVCVCTGRPRQDCAVQRHFVGNAQNLGLCRRTRSMCLRAPASVHLE